jgi:structure-specific recognition protein 1
MEANEDEDMKKEDDAEPASQEKENEITPAKLFSQEILKFAGLGDSGGDILASFHDLPLIVPRGKYTLDMFSTFAKYHGRTHDYKIMYKDIV